jgi:hypothetical protein
MKNFLPGQSVSRNGVVGTVVAVNRTPGMIDVKYSNGLIKRHAAQELVQVAIAKNNGRQSAPRYGRRNPDVPATDTFALRRVKELLAQLEIERKQIVNKISPLLAQKTAAAKAVAPGPAGVAAEAEAAAAKRRPVQTDADRDTIAQTGALEAQLGARVKALAAEEKKLKREKASKKDIEAAAKRTKEAQEALARAQARVPTANARLHQAKARVEEVPSTDDSDATQRRRDAVYALVEAQIAYWKVVPESKYRSEEEKERVVRPLLDAIKVAKQTFRELQQQAALETAPLTAINEKIKALRDIISREEVGTSIEDSAIRTEKTRERRAQEYLSDPAAFTLKHAFENKYKDSEKGPPEPTVAYQKGRESTKPRTTATIAKDFSRISPAEQVDRQGIAWITIPDPPRFISKEGRRIPEICGNTLDGTMYVIAISPQKEYKPVTVSADLWSEAVKNWKGVSDKEASPKEILQAWAGFKEDLRDSLQEVGPFGLSDIRGKEITPDAGKASRLARARETWVDPDDKEANEEVTAILAGSGSTIRSRTELDPVAAATLLSSKRRIYVWREIVFALDPEGAVGSAGTIENLARLIYSRQIEQGLLPETTDKIAAAITESIKSKQLASNSAEAYLDYVLKEYGAEAAKAASSDVGKARLMTGRIKKALDFRSSRTERDLKHFVDIQRKAGASLEYMTETEPELKAVLEKAEAALRTAQALFVVASQDYNWRQDVAQARAEGADSVEALRARFIRKIEGAASRGVEYEKRASVPQPLLTSGRYRPSGRDDLSGGRVQRIESRGEMRMRSKGPPSLGLEHLEIRSRSGGRREVPPDAKFFELPAGSGSYYYYKFNKKTPVGLEKLLEFQPPWRKGSNKKKNPYFSWAPLQRPLDNSPLAAAKTRQKTVLCEAPDGRARNQEAIPAQTRVIIQRGDAKWTQIDIPETGQSGWVRTQDLLLHKRDSYSRPPLCVSVSDSKFLREASKMSLKVSRAAASLNGLKKLLTESSVYLHDIENTAEKPSAKGMIGIVSSAFENLSEFLNWSLALEHATKYVPDRYFDDVPELRLYKEIRQNFDTSKLVKLVVGANLPLLNRQSEELPSIQTDLAEEGQSIPTAPRGFRPMALDGVVRDAQVAGVQAEVDALKKLKVKNSLILESISALNADIQLLLSAPTFSSIVNSKIEGVIDPGHKAKALAQAMSENLEASGVIPTEKEERAHFLRELPKESLRLLQEMSKGNRNRGIDILANFLYKQHGLSDVLPTTPEAQAALFITLSRAASNILQDIYKYDPDKKAAILALSLYGKFETAGLLPESPEARTLLRQALAKEALGILQEIQRVDEAISDLEALRLEKSSVEWSRGGNPKREIRLAEARVKLHAILLAFVLYRGFGGDYTNKRLISAKLVISAMLSNVGQVSQGYAETEETRATLLQSMEKPLSEEDSVSEAENRNALQLLDIQRAASRFGTKAGTGLSEGKMPPRMFYTFNPVLFSVLRKHWGEEGPWSALSRSTPTSIDAAEDVDKVGRYGLALSLFYEQALGKEDLLEVEDSLKGALGTSLFADHIAKALSTSSGLTPEDAEHMFPGIAQLEPGYGVADSFRSWREKAASSEALVLHALELAEDPRRYLSLLRQDAFDGITRNRIDMPPPNIPKGAYSVGVEPLRYSEAPYPQEPLFGEEKSSPSYLWSQSTVAALENLEVSAGKLLSAIERRKEALEGVLTLKRTDS